ncbi:MAG TPA: ATP-binding protein [Microthrixaceae bacterium]|nr:ATP-binding protein [Microthrixaceae bacterium]
MTALVVVLAVAVAVSAGVIATLVTRVRALESAARSTPAPVPAAAEDPTDGSLPRLVAALDALSLGVVVADADEVLGFQNRSAQAILSSRDARTIINRAVRELLVAAVRGEPGEREIDLFGPPKSTYLIRAVPLGNGVAVGGGSVAVIEDVTERRRTDQVRRDFVSNISHELKTPVGAVGLLAETLRDETDLATIRRFSERMSLEVARLSRTIDDLLELSRIEFADDLFIDETRVGDIVEDALGRFRAAADARGITLKSVGESGIVVAGDRRQITSALGNLIDNAVKYSPDGATVTVSARVNPSGLALSVADTGDGIPSRDLDRVFERFYRVDRARSRETGGTGLGLAIVRHVAHNHGGEVSVRSKEGQGSEFTLVLPLGTDVVEPESPVDDSEVSA